MTMTKIHKIIIAAILGVILISVVWFYMSQPSELSKFSSEDFTGLPNELTVDYYGGSGGMVLRFHNEGNTIYSFEPGSCMRVETYINGQWYKVKSQRRAPQANWGGTDCEQGETQFELLWVKELQPGIYRMICTVNELNDDGSFAKLYRIALPFAV